MKSVLEPEESLLLEGLVEQVVFERVRESWMVRVENQQKKRT